MCVIDKIRDLRDLSATVQQQAGNVQRCLENAKIWIFLNTSVKNGNRLYKPPKILKAGILE